MTSIWSTGAHRSTKGQLLVATPPLGDPHFDRSVVFMLEHSSGGAVGVVLNRPDEDLDLFGLDAWTGLLAEPCTGFRGGPVELDALIAIAEAASPHPGAWSDVDAPLQTSGTAVGTVDLSLAPEEVADDIRRVRVFRGYAGWGAGQLEGELDVGAWMVFAATVEDVFTGDPDALWRTVVRRQGGRLAWIADAPDDLSAN